MFKLDKNLKKANVPRTIRFTEPLFEQLGQIASDNDVSFNLLVCNVASMPWIITKMTIQKKL